VLLSQGLQGLGLSRSTAATRSSPSWGLVVPALVAPVSDTSDWVTSDDYMLVAKAEVLCLRNGITR
jgi:hypothetical protein